GAHTIESFLHIAPGLKLEMNSKRIVMISNAKKRYLVSASAGSWRIEDSWYSRSYGIREQNKALVLTLKAEIPATIAFVIKES
ncbi:MAG: hypothetical protein WBD36_07405, partial [Bacteroidota bacterium]